MLILDQRTNFSKGIVLQGYDNAATLISLIPGGGAVFPSVTNGYNLVWWNNTDYADPADDPQVEIVRVVNLTGDVFTVLRAQEGTSATNKNIPNKTYKLVLALTAKMITDIANMAGTGSVLSGVNEGGQFTIFDDVNSTASILAFKTIAAGANITITDNGTYLTIASSGGGGGGITGGNNLGTGNGIFTTVTSGTTMNFKSIAAGTNITFSDDGSTITINASGGGGGGITSINGDTTAAQTIVGGFGISISTVGGVTTVTNTSTGGGGGIGGGGINAAAASNLFDDFIGGANGTATIQTDGIANIGELNWLTSANYTYDTIQSSGGSSDHP